MKKIISLRVAILIVVIISFAVCKKQETEILKPFVNTAPVADAGNDTTIIYPANSVVLDGSNSTDKENNIVNYSWKKISEPLNNDIYIYFQQRESGKALVQNLENKIYQFELTVTDQWGASKDTITVSAIVEPPKPGNTKAVDDITLNLPYNRAYLQTILKVPYPGSFGIIYNWEKISGPNSFNIYSSNSPNTGLGNLVEGVYQIELTVTYGNGFTEKDTTIITVLPDNNIYTAEKLFENVQWTNNYPFLIFSSMNISSIMPPGSPMNVYVKLSLNADWEIVAPQSQWANLYEQSYSIINDVLKVYYNYDPTGWGGAYEVSTANSAIKIEY